MNKIVDLYVTQKNIPARMDVVQASTEPDITFVLKDYTPPAGATARIYIKKPLSEVYNTCTISDSEVTFQPTTGSFDQVGPCTAQLEILAGDEVMVSYRIHVMVEPNTIDSGAIEATDDFTALQDALTAIDQWKTLTEQNAGDIIDIQAVTDKITINNNTENVFFGNGTTQSVEVWGNSTNKIAVGVKNTQDNKDYLLLAKGDGSISLYDRTSGAAVYRIGPYPKGNVTINNCIAHGYSTNTSGRYYFWFETPRQIPDGATLSNVQITNASIRSDSGLVVDRQNLTTNIVDFLRASNLNPRVQFQGITNGFKADHPAFLTCNLSFTIS